MLSASSGPLFLGLASFPFTKAYSWPDYKVDLLEEILYQQAGYAAHGLAANVEPCSTDIAAFETGRTDSAEWLRTAYHDVATADVTAGTGGLDASIIFEAERPENVGKFINESTSIFALFQSPLSSMADLIAMGATMAVASCSNTSVLIPYSVGRVDAQEAGPFGVPQPQEPLEQHIATFARQGFNETEMIGLVACGHTLGGVHGADFPTIVPVLNDPENEDSRVDFDASVASYDNSIAVQFVNNVTQDPLAFGPNITTRSDHRIFTSDGSSMITKMAESLDHYFQTCTALLERMLNTVPNTVTLTPAPPIPVKPRDVYLSVNMNDTLTFTGAVRLLEGDVLSATDLPDVNIVYVPRNGDACSECSISAITTPQLTSGSTYNGNHTPSFQYYTWSSLIPISTGISGFRVEVVDRDNTTTYGNDDSLFPVQDSFVLEYEQSCYSTAFGDTSISPNWTLTASARDGANLSSFSFTNYKPIPVPDTFAFKFEKESVAMTPGAPIGSTGYTSYSVHYGYAVEGFSLPMVVAGLTAQDGDEEIGNPYIFSSDLRFCASDFTS